MFSVQAAPTFTLRAVPRMEILSVHPSWTGFALELPFFILVRPHQTALTAETLQRVTGPQRAFDCREHKRETLTTANSSSGTLRAALLPKQEKVIKPATRSSCVWVYGLNCLPEVHSQGKPSGNAILETNSRFQFFEKARILIDRA